MWVYNIYDTGSTGLAELGLLSDECRPISLDLMIVRFGLLSLSLSGALARLAGISPLSPIIISLSIEISFAVIFFLSFSDCTHTHTHNALVKKQKKATSIFSLSFNYPAFV